MRNLLERHPRSKEALLDILHELQDADPRRHLSDQALRAAAEYLEIPLAEVVSTATFYSMYSRRPRGLHIVRMCNSPPCQLTGAGKLLGAVAEYLGVEVGGTTADGTFTLETSSCLGLCAEAPVMMVDDRVYGGLTKETALGILAELRSCDGTD
jgi:NADH-quinone oxidoreductase subunit E